MILRVLLGGSDSASFGGAVVLVAASHSSVESLASFSMA